MKLTTASLASIYLSDLGFPTTVFGEEPDFLELRIKGGQEYPTICCFCSVGCGAICTVENGELINIEGDPDHPINEGTLCGKGVAQFSIRSIYNDINAKRKQVPEMNPFRITKVLYRAPRSKKWEERDWNWALKKIARRVRETRDKYFLEKDKTGAMVNRNEAIAFLGGAALNNEECYLIQKLARALGVVYIEHQARI